MAEYIRRIRNDNAKVHDNPKAFGKDLTRLLVLYSTLIPALQLVKLVFRSARTVVTTVSVSLLNLPIVQNRGRAQEKAL